jgi:hypothetical protein
VTDQRDELAFGNGQVNVLERAKRSFLGFEGLLYALDFNVLGTE